MSTDASKRVDVILKKYLDDNKLDGFVSMLDGGETVICKCSHKLPAGLFNENYCTAPLCFPAVFKNGELEPVKVSQDENR